MVLWIETFNFRFVIDICSQNRDQVSTSPVNCSSFIGGILTECASEHQWVVEAEGSLAGLAFVSVQASLFSISLLDLEMARLAVSTYTSDSDLSAAYSLSSRKSWISISNEKS